jgi:holliday junction DNA helicase RuvA
MIAHLKGTRSYKSPVYVVVDVNGVGYQVFVSLSTFYALPESGGAVFLKIHTHVREDAFKLFGFLTSEEQLIFEKLISISKVGPKLALSILSGMQPVDFMTAILENDVARISTIPGVGKKTAERLTLELKDKLKDITIEFSPDGEQAVPTGGVVDDAVSALVNLGYKKPQAEKTVKSIWEKNGKSCELENLIKESLNVLS